MPEQWLSVAQAAATMKVHPRTVERRIVANKIESRRNDDGQIEVMVLVPDEVEAIPPDAYDTMKEMADRQVDIAAGSASALVRLAQDQTVRAESQLILARQDARRYRTEARVAVYSLAATLLLVIGAVAWCTHTVTAINAEARRVADIAALGETERNQAIGDARQAQLKLAAEQDVERKELQREQECAHQADVAKAKAEGELAAYKTELSGVVALTSKRTATSQPGGILSRLTQAFSGN